MGCTEIVRLLLEAGKHFRTSKNQALRVAVNNGHTEVARLLSERGAVLE